MTLMTQSYQAPTTAGREGEAKPGFLKQVSDAVGETNVGSSERTVSVAAGAILAVEGLSRRTIPGMLIAAVGGAMIFRGATGHCHAYQAMGINTAEPAGDGANASEVAKNGFHVEQVFTIRRSAEDLYREWRNLENLPRIMTHLQSVTVLDDRKSHWVAKAPSIAGGKVEWDAELTTDEPNRLIAWRSLAGSDVDSVGQVRFDEALGDRGTEVHVFMDYVPPAGRLGKWVATIFGKSARHQMREDLRTFKAVMETGEAPMVAGQPRGTCTGQGKYQSA